MQRIVNKIVRLYNWVWKKEKELLNGCLKTGLEKNYTVLA